MRFELNEFRRGKPTKFKTVLNVKKENGGLIFNFTCDDCQFFCPFNEYNKNIFRGDVVEVFIATEKTDMDKRYFEFELAPNGTAFCALITNKKGNGKKIVVDLLEKGFETNVVKLENGYIGEFRIPLEFIGVKENDVVNFNAYRIETEGFMPDKVCLSLYPTHSIEFHVRKSFRELDLSLL
jgi:hypothetical protein